VSHYTRATASAAEASEHTLEETERAAAERMEGLSIDMTAMAAVSNVYRAAGTVRNYFERTVLRSVDLTWTAWVVLWVVWIWGEIESRHVAFEAGVSKGTLTGVARTLEARGLLSRRTHPDDGRRVLIELTDKGGEVMERLFPEFNNAEQFVTSVLDDGERLALAQALRKIVVHLERGTTPNTQLRSAG